MNDQERERLKQSILEGIEKTRADIEIQEEERKNTTADTGNGRINRMVAMYSQQASGSALERSKGRLDKLEYLLSIVNTPDFGLCQCCRSPIPIARMMAMPECTTCVRCAG